jgi:hypothetical protein
MSATIRAATPADTGAIFALTDELAQFVTGDALTCLAETA